jgi:hypothetical protein
MRLKGGFFSGCYIILTTYSVSLGVGNSRYIIARFGFFGTVHLHGMAGHNRCTILYFQI